MHTSTQRNSGKGKQKIHTPPRNPSVFGLGSNQLYTKTPLPAKESEVVEMKLIQVACDDGR
ncbi:MAG: hypothetical protein HN759_10645 [Akkermansiaceae bacterium]|nr:hypothetical protein [Akkermansiaceae bacterium]